MGRLGTVKSAGVALALAALNGPAQAQVVAQQVENVPLPAGVDVFNLSFDEIKRYASVKDFEILGHSYFKVDQRTPYAKGQGRSGPELGSGFNTVRVYDGIAYLGGYNSPPTLFATLIVDVRDPKNMKVLSAIPCNPGTRCGYLRVNRQKKILIIGHDSDPRGNPDKPPAGEKAKAGWSFHDVSDPSKPKEQAFVPATQDGKTHGLEIDDRYLYGCGTFSPDMTREGLQIINFRVPHVQDAFDPETKAFVCPGKAGTQRTISNTTHLPWYDRRSPSLVYVTWYDEVVRVIDISNPFAPRFMGYYLSPRFAAPNREDRQTREIFQDPDTNLLYVTDGNGGGMTVLRYTGAIPDKRPIPGAR